MTLQGFSQLVRHGQAWCEESYYLGLAFFEVLRGTLLEEFCLFPFSGDFWQWRTVLVHLEVAVNKRGKSVREQLRSVPSTDYCHPISKGVCH